MNSAEAPLSSLHLASIDQSERYRSYHVGFIIVQASNDELNKAGRPFMLPVMSGLVALDYYRADVERNEGTVWLGKLIEVRT